jgi:hypothetical protein
MGADTKFGGWFELQAAYSSDCSVVLPLRPSARAAPPLGPRLFNERLRAWERVRVLRVSMGADSAQKRTLWGSSALEMGDHRLLEDGSERGGALVTDHVVLETAARGGDGERVGVSMGIDTKANTRAAAHPRFVICVSLRMAASAEAPSAPMLLYPRL